MVTAGTYLKEHFFSDERRLDFLHDALLRTAILQGWQYGGLSSLRQSLPLCREALALSLWFHHDPEDMVSQVHQESSNWVNEQDGAPERKVWHNFWDSTLTYEKSWIARLNYVHGNPVKHGMVKLSRDYPWCSAAWFERVAAASWIKTVYAFKTDRLKIEDDF